jgi:hypothetical protein
MIVNTTAAYVVIILLHGNHRWPVDQVHSSQPEVGVVGYIANLLHEFIKGGGWDAIDSSDEERTPKPI